MKNLIDLSFWDNPKTLTGYPGVKPTWIGVSALEVGHKYQFKTTISKELFDEIVVRLKESGEFDEEGINVNIGDFFIVWNPHVSGIGCGDSSAYIFQCDEGEIKLNCWLYNEYELTNAPEILCNEDMINTSEAYGIIDLITKLFAREVPSTPGSDHDFDNIPQTIHIKRGKASFTWNGSPYSYVPVYYLEEPDCYVIDKDFTDSYSSSTHIYNSRFNQYMYQKPTNIEYDFSDSSEFELYPTKIIYHTDHGSSGSIEKICLYDTKVRNDVEDFTSGPETGEKVWQHVYSVCLSVVGTGDDSPGHWYYRYSYFEPYYGYHVQNILRPTPENIEIVE